MPLMHFKQVSFYTFTKDVEFTQESLAKALESARFREDPADRMRWGDASSEAADGAEGDDQAASKKLFGGIPDAEPKAGSSLPVRFGWSSPVPFDNDLLVYEQNGCLLFALQKAEKVLPSSVVNQKLDQRVQTIEVKDGRKLRRKEKQEMKEDLIAELLPKAFSKSSWTRAYIDTHRQLLVVASGSANKSDEITALLREDVGSLPVLPANPDSSPALHFTDWVSNGSQPKQFELGGACSLTSPEEQGMSIRCKGSENLNDAVHMHIEDGLLVNKLDLVWEERLAFAVDESCRLGGIKMLDAALDSLGDTEGDLADRFASEFHVFSSDMRTLFDDLMAALGNEPEEAQGDAAADQSAPEVQPDTGAQSEAPAESEVPDSEKAPF